MIFKTPIDTVNAKRYVKIYAYHVCESYENYLINNSNFVHKGHN